ncbi:MAG: hypothetical protein KC635_24735 [Myxococcales bacterium]|nr:hypothetical protein [Myxococcales bacterium]
MWILTSEAGCQKSAPADADATAATGLDAAASGTQKKRMPGVVRWNDEMLPFGSLVLHNAQMDLRTQCRLLRDDEVKAGKPEILCYEDRVRDRDAVKRIRVEYGTTRVGPVMRVLRAKHEAAHFLVEKDGVAHELLDMAFAARRDGAVQPEEIRVIAMAPEVYQGFVAALKALFPHAEVVTVPLDLTVPPPPPTAAETAPPPDTDTVQGEDAATPRHFADDDAHGSTP